MHKKNRSTEGRTVFLFIAALQEELNAKKAVA
jgi:hypothetical protein